MLRHAADVLSKTEYEAPFDGVITNVPVREGETVVPGIQNSPGSTLMTIADTSIITAEVKVDESDIVNVQAGTAGGSNHRRHAQAEVQGSGHRDRQKCVAPLHRRFHRANHVQRAGSERLQGGGGLARSAADLLPGLSATARITTAKRSSALAIPIQALTIRERGELTPEKKGKGSSVQAAAPTGRKSQRRVAGRVRPQEQKGRVFVPVATGISGTTDIEVTSGLKEGDEIVTGSYKVLRTLRNGASVKVDNTIKPKDEES